MRSGSPRPLSSFAGRPDRLARRLGIAALLAGAFVLATAGAAGAHALYRSSVPVNGADLKHAPSKVVGIIGLTQRPFVT